MKNAYKLQFLTSEMKEIRSKHDMSKEDRQREYEMTGGKTKTNG